MRLGKRGETYLAQGYKNIGQVAGLELTTLIVMSPAFVPTRPRALLSHLRINQY